MMPGFYICAEGIYLKIFGFGLCIKYITGKILPHP
jgi:hypothetical protein